MKRSKKGHLLELECFKKDVAEYAAKHKLFKNEK